MSSDNKPIIRSSDMKEEYKNIVLSIAQDVIDEYTELQSRQFDIARNVRIELHKQFKELGVQQQSNKWSVAIGKNFVVSTDVKRGWYAHVYLKHSMSMLIWKIN